MSVTHVSLTPTPSPQVLTQELIDYAKERGLEVVVWVWKQPLPHSDTGVCYTVLQRRGVDKFTTDMPPALFEWQSKQLRSKN